MDAAQVALDYWLEPLTPESLPAVAAELLADGYDSPALRETAGMPPGDVVCVREVFVRALREMGVHVDSREDAQVRQLRPWVRQTLDGSLTRAELSARVGRIWRIRDLVDHDRFPAAVVNLVLACLGDDSRVDDAKFVGALRGAGQALG